MKTQRISRKQFMHTALLGGISLPITLVAQTQQDKPTPIKAELVKEFVVVSHTNLEKVKELLENEPQLLHVSHDWGAGDFESGIEAAGHMGNTEIATYLLGKGARYNIYLACMLGHLDVVKSVLSFNSGLLNSKGPHGFTLLHHAIKGGDTSLPVVEYLKSLGASKTIIDFYPKR
jgi:hypothetical protein